jgi:signal-transduction protein with cAMP-binding, CBS, and nucleotidyltransferase domain
MAASGTILFQRGDAYRGFYLLVEGGVHVYRLSPEGRMLVLHVIRPGESFAEVPLFETDAGDTYPATAEMLTDSALFFFPADAFLSFVDAHPRSALHMLGQMAGRLRSAVRQLDAMSLQDVTERLARYLVEQVPTVSDNPPHRAHRRARHSQVRPRRRVGHRSRDALAGASDPAGQGPHPDGGRGHCPDGRAGPAAPRGFHLISQVEPTEAPTGQ